MGLPNFYLAAPFFNEPQVKLVEQIENLFHKYEVPLFSPRKHRANQKKGPLTDDDAAEIFDSNYHEIIRCNRMLAVVDWLMPEDQSVRIVTETEERSIENDPRTGYRISTTSLNLPDTGTVWEMGCAYGYGATEIVIFTTRSPKQPLNIMLTQCAVGVCYGLENLENYLFHKCDNGLLDKYKGKHQ